MLLISGCTGRLGRELLRVIDPGSVLALVRGGDPAGRLRTLERVAGRPVAGVSGDLTAPCWGLADRVDDLLGGVTAVVNLAADTGWGSSSERLTAVNVGGPEQAVHLAARLGVPVIHVSTLFVGHGRPGTVPEDLVLETAQLSDYERSKCRGEWAAADFAASLGVPLLIARTCGLLDPLDPPPARRGQAARSRAPYGRLLESAHRLAPLLYNADARIDLLPVDVVATALGHRLAAPVSDGVQVVHLGAADQAVGVAALLAEARRRLRHSDGRARPAVAVPEDVLFRLSAQGRVTRDPVLAARLVAVRYLAATTVYGGCSLGRGISLGDLVDRLLGLRPETATVGDASFYGGWVA